VGIAAVQSFAASCGQIWRVRKYRGSAELDRHDIVSKRREGAGGRLAGGQHFSRGALYLMLQNRIYRGEITHQGTAFSLHVSTSTKSR
jgi:hypothetical protein